MHMPAPFSSDNGICQWHIGMPEDLKLRSSLVTKGRLDPDKFDRIWINHMLDGGRAERPHLFEFRILFRSLLGIAKKSSGYIDC